MHHHDSSQHTSYSRNTSNYWKVREPQRWEPGETTGGTVQYRHLIPYVTYQTRVPGGYPPCIDTSSLFPSLTVGEDQDQLCDLSDTVESSCVLVHLISSPFPCLSIILFFLTLHLPPPVNWEVRTRYAVYGAHPRPDRRLRLTISLSL